MKPTIVLGISSGHGDSSAALIVNGKLVAAAEEERFTRVKHYALFPEKAIQYCLKHASVNPTQVEAVAVARRPWNLFFYRLNLLLQHPSLWKARRTKERTASLADSLRKMGLASANIVRVEHHLAHLMSTRYIGPEGLTSFLSFDGLGDFVSAAAGRPKENSIEVLDRVRFPHSLGFFYTAMTQHLGFPHFGDEYKVMGLSSYGKPKYLDVMRELVRETPDKFGFTLNLEAFPILENPIKFYLENAQPVLSPFYSSAYLTHMVGIAPRKAGERITEQHQNLAKSVQARFEEVANHLLRQLHAQAPNPNVALSGGCAHNSVWVGKIPQQTPFKNVYVAPASHDGGLAVGAAIQVAKNEVTPEEGHWALLGPTPADAPSENNETAGVEARTFSSDKKLIDWMIDQLAEGKILGLCRGRLEFGPRALGSRSILADPRRADMKDKLNARVKHRESFRPFAASVLAEKQAEWFENAFFSPTMEAVFEVRESKRTKILGVVHADNTCRIQSVARDTQPFFCSLLEAFFEKTGVPMLINTSFNDSEPIVCTAQDAIHCFLNCEIDHLILENRVYSRTAGSQALAG